MSVFIYKYRHIVTVLKNKCQPGKMQKGWNLEFK